MTEEMTFSLIDGTDLRVSRLSFGTGSLHHVFSRVERQNILSAALVAGISHFDTSPYYGYGLAELDLGNFLAGRRSKVTIATKVGLYPYGGADNYASSVWLRKAMGKIATHLSKPEVDWHVERARMELRVSLRRLKTDYVDVLFLHEPHFRISHAEELHRWLEVERALGTVRHWGLAGEAGTVAPWVCESNPLAWVVQTRDSCGARQADFMLDCHRLLQFTYGYQSAKAVGTTAEQYLDQLRAALSRNSAGSVIVSSRKARRVAQLSRLIE